MEQQLPPELIAEVHDIFRDDFEDLQPMLRNGLSADLPIIRKQNERLSGVVDVHVELIQKALELRQRRLGRVRQEIIAIFADSSPNPEDITYYSQVASWTNNAKRLIDDEISRQARKINA